MIDNPKESPPGRRLDLRQLQTFVVVAEQRHFGRAAALLNITQPAASKQIRQLELHIGAQLLERTSRQVELTPAGQALLGDARGLLDHANRTALRTSRAARGAIGQLTIGFRDSASNDFLPDLIKAYRARYPDVTLVLEECSSGSDQLDALRQERIDIAFVRPPIEDPSLKADLVLNEDLVAVLPHDHRLAKRKRVPVSALSNEPFVLWPRRANHAVYDRVFGPHGTLGFVPDVKHEAIGTLSVLGLVSAGLGVSLLPSSVLTLTRDGVALRLLTPPAPSLPLSIVRRLADQSKTVANFVTITRDLLPNHPPRRSQSRRPSPVRD